MHELFGKIFEALNSVANVTSHFYDQILIFAQRYLIHFKAFKANELKWKVGKVEQLELHPPTRG